MTVAPLEEGVATGVREGPMPVDAAFARRMAELMDGVGSAVARDVREIIDGSVDSTIPAAEARALVDRHGLQATMELALLSLPVADEMARPSISGFRVAAVGIEAQTGDLLLGANLEFPGTELTTTIHAEGFVGLRARRRGHDLALLALPRANSCAHCRQVLAESASAAALRIVDPVGHQLTLAGLYPWQFGPANLGMRGDAPGGVNWPDLRLEDSFNGPAEVAAALLGAGARAHAPYSAAPSAAVLRAADGSLLGAGCVESVAFNPSISALQAALVELAAARIDRGDIAEAWLAIRAGGPIDPEPGFRSLLRAVAPGARGHVVGWLDAG